MNVLANFNYLKAQTYVVMNVKNNVRSLCVVEIFSFTLHVHEIFISRSSSERDLNIQWDCVPFKVVDGKLNIQVCSYAILIIMEALMIILIKKTCLKKNSLYAYNRKGLII